MRGLERGERGLRAEADGALLEVLALVDVTADGAEVERVVVGGVQVVVRGQVAQAPEMRFRSVASSEQSGAVGFSKSGSTSLTRAYSRPMWICSAALVASNRRAIWS